LYILHRHAISHKDLLICASQFWNIMWQHLYSNYCFTLHS
jgi:hypothetical protein